MKKRIRIKLRGGLGNQLHIFIAAWVIGVKTGRDLVLDGRFISWTGSNPDRRIEIHKFRTPPVSNHTNRYRRTIPSPKENSVIRKGILKALDVFVSLKSHKKPPNDTWENSKDIENYAFNENKLEGHFLDLRWLERAFELGFPDQLELVNTAGIHITTRPISEFCAIHVRLTDFLHDNNGLVNLTEEYYLSAVELLISNGHKDFLLFTDDVNRITDYFPRLTGIQNLQVIPASLSSVESFYLMHRSSAIITANSTFSTLAAMFIWRRGGEVVAPSKRYVEREFEEYWVPVEWIILDSYSGQNANSI